MKPASKWILLTTGVVGIAGTAFFAGRALAGGIPATGALTYSGLLQDANGAALTGSHAVQVNFWNAATGGTTPACQTASTAITLDAGRFSVALPDTCTDIVKTNKDTWADVLVDGISLGRTKLGAVPYAVEAGHATGADSATSAAGSLLTTITQMQTDITALKGSYVVAGGYTIAPVLLVDHVNYVWVSGATPIDVTPGEKVFVSNTSQTWAAPSNHGTAGCSACVSGTAVMKACYRVGTAAPTLTPSAYTQSDAAGYGPGSEVSTNGWFSFTTATAGVSFGLCARLYDASPTRWDMNVGNVHTIVQGHK